LLHADKWPQSTDGRHLASYCLRRLTLPLQLSRAVELALSYDAKLGGGKGYHMKALGVVSGLF